MSTTCESDDDSPSTKDSGCPLLDEKAWTTSALPKAEVANRVSDEGRTNFGLYLHPVVITRVCCGNDRSADKPACHGLVKEKRNTTRSMISIGTITNKVSQTTFFSRRSVSSYVVVVIEGNQLMTN